jgi:hypothetical protein
MCLPPLVDGTGLDGGLAYMVEHEAHLGHLSTI